MSASLIPYVAVAESGERRGADRRARAKLGSRQTLDTLFAATLVNQIAPAELVYLSGYDTQRHVRAGIAFDLKA